MKNYFKILIKSPMFMIGLVVLSLVLVFAYLYPVFNPADPFAMVDAAFVSPNGTWLLGTDNFGRNEILELAYGIQTSLLVGVLSGLIATVLGVVVGLISGYRGGLLDEALTALTNMFIIIPSFVILILVSVSIDGRSLEITAAIIGLTSWPWTARAIRAQTVSLRSREHIAIAKLSGFGSMRIILTEILPYIASYVVMAFIIQLASGILSEAAVSMLGLGPYNTISLGIMMNWALMFEAPISGAWWAFFPAATAIAAVTFSLYLMNMGMDEIFNPKLRS